MRRRVVELVGPRAERMWVSTFHSACLRILRSHADRLGYRSGFTVYDDTDSRRLVEIVMSELGLDTKRLPPRSVAAVIGQAKAELVDVGAVRRGVGERLRPVPPPHRRRLPRVPAAAGGGQRHGLRRPAAAGGAAAAHLRRRACRLPAAVPPHPGRRVPGHQPGPERAGRPAWARTTATSAWWATPTSRSTPSGAPTSATSCTSRRRSPHDHGRARAELPLHPDHPRRRQRGHRQQPGPPAQAALHRGRPGRADPPLPGRGRARRGPVGGRRDPAAPARRGPLLRRGGRLLPHQRPEPGGRGGAGAGRPSPTRWSAAPASTTAGR